MQRSMQEARMDDSALKAWYKQQKKQDKEKAKQRKAEVKQGIAAKENRACMCSISKEVWTPMR